MATNIDTIKLKKCNVNGVKCRYVNVNGVRVFTSSVLLTNLIGDSHETNFDGMDAAWAWRSAAVYRTVQANHRYYVRWNGRSYGGGYHSVSETMELYGAGVNISQSGFGTKHQIVMPTSDGSLAMKSSSHCCTDAGTSSLIYTDAYMLVDLTELEETMGTTFTASSFWSYIGSAIFYGSKEFEV